MPWDCRSDFERSLKLQREAVGAFGSARGRAVATRASSGRADADLPSEPACNVPLKFPLTFLPAERSAGAERPKPARCLRVASVSSSRATAGRQGENSLARLVARGSVLRSSSGWPGEISRYGKLQTEYIFLERKLRVAVRGVVSGC